MDEVLATIGVLDREEVTTNVHVAHCITEEICRSLLTEMGRIVCIEQGIRYRTLDAADRAANKRRWTWLTHCHSARFWKPRIISRLRSRRN